MTPGQVAVEVRGRRRRGFVKLPVQRRQEMLADAKYIFFGCWTSGLFFVLQKPEQAWVNFAARLEGKPDAKVALFTTYKILTGSMFSNMAKHLEGKFATPALELKSRNQHLTAQNKQAIDAFISGD